MPRQIFTRNSGLKKTFESEALIVEGLKGIDPNGGRPIYRRPVFDIFHIAQNLPHSGKPNLAAMDRLVRGSDRGEAAWGETVSHLARTVCAVWITPVNPATRAQIMGSSPVFSDATMTCRPVAEALGVAAILFPEKVGEIARQAGCVEKLDALRAMADEGMKARAALPTQQRPDFFSW